MRPSPFFRVRDKSESQSLRVRVIQNFVEPSQSRVTRPVEALRLIGLFYGKSAHSVGGTDWLDEMARALIQYLLISSRSDRVALISSLVKLRELERINYIFAVGAGKRAKLF